MATTGYETDVTIVSVSRDMTLCDNQESSNPFWDYKAFGTPQWIVVGIVFGGKRGFKGYINSK